MPKEKNAKPQGILEGIAKSFLGLPDSRVLNTEEKGVVAGVRGNELVRHQTSAITKQGDRAQESAQRAFLEIQGIRSATQAGAIALKGTHIELMDANRSLSRIDGALEHGLPAISEGLEDLNITARRTAGLPKTPRNVDELMRCGEVEESETIILAISGGLTDEQQKKVFGYLEPWKRDIIESGMIYRHDPKMEKTLSQPEKIFLAGLRRKASSGILSFESVETLVWHGVLEEKFQFNLSKIMRGARQGTVGIIDATHELADQGETRIAQGSTLIQQNAEGLDLQKRRVSQGNTRISQGEILNKLQAAHLLIGRASLEEQQGIRTGVDTLVDLQRLSQIDRHATRLATEETAQNTGEMKQHTLAIARGVAAQVYLQQRAEQRLDRISEATEGTYRNTELLTVFAERANEIAEANYSVNAETAQNTGAIVTNTRELVGFAARNELQNAIMIEQGATSIRLLGDIADGVDTGNYYQALTREAIQEMHVTLIRGFSNIVTMGMAHLEEAMKSNALLSALTQIQEIHHTEIINALGGIEGGMERRHLSVNQARAQERFQEGMGKYRKGKIDDAIKLFHNSVKQWSNDYRVYFYRGICYVLKDQPKKAEEDLKEAFEWTEGTDTRVRAIIKMNLARLYYSESKVYLENGNSDLSDEKMLAAIITAQEANQEDSDFLETSFALATYLAAFKLYDEARIMLMKIILKEPTFAVKMLFIPELAPILESFKHTVGENIEESNKDTTNRVTIAIIKDCIEIGEFSTAIVCIKKLMETGSIYLLRLKIWEIQELNPIRQQIIDTIVTTIDSMDSADSQNCYAIAVLALEFRSNPDEISDFKVFDAFLKGTENDPDVKAQNKVAMEKKLRALSETKLSDLLGINKLHRKGLEWLN